jgi:HTH-type transcriptional regulator/antitoxin HigA
MATYNDNLIPGRATHPGILIQDEIEARPGLSQKSLAFELDVKPSFLNEIIKGKRPITADFAILLEKALDISAEYWMRFQSQYEINQARLKEKNIKRLKNIEAWSIVKENISIDYLSKHNKLSGDIETDIEIVKKIYGVDDLEELKGELS